MGLREKVIGHRDEILALADSHGLESIRIFGSVARGEDRPDSDVDFLVRRRAGSDPFLMLDLKERLESLLGCGVDLITDQPLMRQRLRRNIERDLIPL